MRAAFARPTAPVLRRLASTRSEACHEIAIVASISGMNASQVTGTRASATMRATLKSGRQMIS